MAHSLAEQRCFNHAQREAVARCPECRNFFCRECVTEYEDRVLCATCLARAAEKSERRARRWAHLAQAAQCAGAVLLLWCIFYFLGLGLLAVPTSFHENTVWKVQSEFEDTP